MEGRLDRVMMFADRKAKWDSKGISCSIIGCRIHQLTDYVNGISGDGMCPDWIASRDATRDQLRQRWLRDYIRSQLLSTQTPIQQHSLHCHRYNVNPIVTIDDINNQETLIWSVEKQRKRVWYACQQQEASVCSFPVVTQPPASTVLWFVTNISSW